MNVRRNFAGLFVLALAAAALSVGTSYGQDFQGKFTLDMQAQWGNISLQPGDYTLTVSRFQGGLRKVEVRADARGAEQAVILPESQDASAAPNQSALVCVRQNGALVVRVLEVAGLGETIHFKTPKATLIYAERRGVESRLLAQGPELIERVTVTSRSM